VLSELCQATVVDQNSVQILVVVSKETDLIEQSILFFLNTLTKYEILSIMKEDNHSTDDASKLFYTLQLQKEVGLACLRYITSFGMLVNQWHQKLEAIVSLQDFHSCGRFVVKVSVSSPIPSSSIILLYLFS
jgi:hypothetical protein